jgi:protein ImuB
MNCHALSLNRKEKRDDMAKRFVTIWFRQLKTDWFANRQPSLRSEPFVLAAPDHGRIVITEVNDIARSQEVVGGMVVADARAILPALNIIDDPPGLAEKLLRSIAVWCIRYTDIVAIDPPNGIIMDVTGCAHLWGGESKYIRDINLHLTNRGYQVRACIADTIGTAWAVTHYGNTNPIVERGKQMETLIQLPASALRLESETVDRLHKLGLHQIRHFIAMPRSALRRRFGKELLLSLDRALGNEDEPVTPVIPVEPWRERLPCLEPIVTATGIEIALQRLLERICKKLQQEEMGIRQAVFSGFRVDGKQEKIEIGTHRATHQTTHLYKLFENKICTIEPGLGIELFMIEAIKTEKCLPRQEKIWDISTGLEDTGLSELLDRLTNRFGSSPIHRFLPDEHHLPEYSYKESVSLAESPATTWNIDRPRPLQLLSRPQSIEVAAPIPDYPPMHFRYLGKLHTIKKSDGPERIEPEWWIGDGSHRDYYAVEDDQGQRFWLFRSGRYCENETPKWFIHGFFA